MRYRRMPIEIESPEELGYDTIAHNLSESSVADRSLDDLGLDLDLDGLVLCYGDHLGDPSCERRSRRPATASQPDDVLVTPGAAAALFAVATSLLGPGDHAVVVRTNYATNLETPRAIGADVDFLDLRFEDGFRLDLDRLAALVRPDTKLVSITCPHNPTGTMCTRDELAAVVELVERARRDAAVDETYRDLTHGEPLPLAASLSDRASAWLDVEGLRAARAAGRLGGRPATRPARDPAGRQGADRDLRRHPRRGDRAPRPGRPRPHPAADQGHVADHLEPVAAWIDGEDRVEWVPPSGGVVCFPRFRAEVDGRRRPLLRRAARPPRHLRGPGPLVRRRPPPLPPRVRLADHRGPRRRSGRAVEGARRR